MPIDLKSTQLGKNGFEQPRVILEPDMEVPPPTGFSWPFTVVVQPMVVTAQAGEDEEEDWVAYLQISPDNGSTFTDVVIHTKPVKLSADNTLLTIPIAGMYRLRTETENTTYIRYTLTMTHDPVLPMVDLSIQGAQGLVGPTGATGATGAASTVPGPTGATGATGPESAGGLLSQITDISGVELVAWYTDSPPNIEFVSAPGVDKAAIPFSATLQWFKEDGTYDNNGGRVSLFYGVDDSVPSSAIDIFFIDLITGDSFFNGNLFFGGVFCDPAVMNNAPINGTPDEPIDNITPPTNGTLRVTIFYYVVGLIT